MYRPAECEAIAEDLRRGSLLFLSFYKKSQCCVNYHQDRYWFIDVAKNLINPFMWESWVWSEHTDKQNFAPFLNNTGQCPVPSDEVGGGGQSKSVLSCGSVPQASETSGQADRMHKAVALVSLLVLGGLQTLQGHLVLTDPLYPTQENFDQVQVSDWDLLWCSFFFLWSPFNALVSYFTLLPVTTAGC